MKKELRSNLKPAMGEHDLRSDDSFSLLFTFFFLPRIFLNCFSFPPGFEYRWKDGVGIKTPIKCSGPEYVDYVLTWVEGQMNNEKIFPTTGPFK